MTTRDDVSGVYALDHVEIDPHARGKSRYLVFPGPKYQLNGASYEPSRFPSFCMRQMWFWGWVWVVWCLDGLSRGAR